MIQVCSNIGVGNLSQRYYCTVILQQYCINFRPICFYFVLCSGLDIVLKILNRPLFVKIAHMEIIYEVCISLQHYNRDVDYCPVLSLFFNLNTILLNILNRCKNIPAKSTRVLNHRQETPWQIGPVPSQAHT